MLSPYQLPHFIRYFDGIDLAVSKRLSRRVPSTETTLTQEFCALMDAEDQRREGSLAFNADALQAALEMPGDMLDVDVTIAAHQHGPSMEAYVSQADFGLILEYQNTVIPKLNWKAAYLMQAKRLFPDPGGSYSVTSKFSSTSLAQQQRMRDLADILGESAVRYWLYMPVTTSYESASTSAIRALHNEFFARQIFDYPLGLALHEAVARSGGIDAGMWVVDLASFGKTAADIHRVAFRKSQPFTWFILQHFWKRFSQLARDPQVDPNDVTPADLTERITKIAAGDRQAAQELIDELGDKARDKSFDPEGMAVLPGHSVTIRIRSGPPDGVDLPVPPDEETARY